MYLDTVKKAEECRVGYVKKNNQGEPNEDDLGVGGKRIVG